MIYLVLRESHFVSSNPTQLEPLITLSKSIPYTKQIAKLQEV